MSHFVNKCKEIIGIVVSQQIKLQRMSWILVSPLKIAFYMKMRMYGVRESPIVPFPNALPIVL